jgi:hypothetical protein
MKNEIKKWAKSPMGVLGAGTGLGLDMCVAWAGETM